MPAFAIFADICVLAHGSETASSGDRGTSAGSVNIIKSKLFYI